MALNVRRIAVSALLSMIAVPMSPAASAPTDIVVSGHPQITRKEVQRLTRAIVPSTNDQMARMVERFCPTIFGLPESVGQIMRDRMAQDAHDLGVSTGTATCRPNVLIIFAEDAQALLRGIRQDNPALFGTLRSSEISKLIAGRGPAYLWSSTSIRDEDGDSISHSRINGLTQSTRRIPAAHIMDLSTIQNVDWSVIVIEQSAAIGKTVRQLADYAAVRTLSQANIPSSFDGVDTILTLFETDSPPSQITSFDSNFVKALYSGKANKSYIANVAQISHDIDKHMNQTDRQDTPPHK